MKSGVATTAMRLGWDGSGTQGSLASSATLGWEPESRWDSTGLGAGGLGLWQLLWAGGVRKPMREPLHGRSQPSPIRSAFSLFAVVRVGIVAVAAASVGCRDRRVLSNHPPSFTAQFQARTLESELMQLALMSPHLFPMGQPMILDGAQLSSLMETNGFRQVPRTSWGGAYTAVVCNGTQGMRSVVLFTEGKQRSTGW